jgi:hypothetical protein
LVFELPLRLAVRVTEVVPIDVPAVMGKVALVAPAETVTLAGKVTTVLLLERATDTPPAGAAPVSVAVPIALPPLGI